MNEASGQQQKLQRQDKLRGPLTEFSPKTYRKCNCGPSDAMRADLPFNEAPGKQSSGTWREKTSPIPVGGIRYVACTSLLSREKQYPFQMPKWSTHE